MRAPVTLKIPQTLDGLEDWVVPFYAAVNTGYGTYGLSSANVSGLGALVATFTAARLANQPPNRNIQSTSNLREAKQALLDAVRPLAQIISNQPESIVSRAAKVALRVNPHWNSKGVSDVIGAEPRTRIEIPPVAPDFYAEAAGNLGVKVRYHFHGAPVRQNSPKNHIRSSAKPIFATAVQFYYKLLPPTRPDPYAGMVPMVTATKSPFAFYFDPSIGGRQVYIACRYVNARGETGPWSEIYGMTVSIEGYVAPPGA